MNYSLRLLLSVCLTLLLWAGSGLKGPMVGDPAWMAIAQPQFPSVTVTDAAVVELSTLSVLPDPEGNLSVESILSEAYRDRFESYTLGQSIDTRTHTYWIKLVLTPADVSIEQTYLDLGQWDFIDAYGPNDFHQQTGMLVPLRDRPVTKNFSNTTVLQLPLQGETAYIMRVATDFSKLTTQRPNFVGKLYNAAHLTHMDFGIGLYCGWLLVMALYNLFIYFSVRDLSYLYYTLYLFFFALVWVSFFGYGYQYVWPYGSPHWNKIAANVFGFPFVIFFVQFAQSFLNTRRYSPSIHRALNLCRLIFCSIGLFFFSSAWFYGFVVGLFALNGILVLMLVGGVIAYRKGYHSALFFVIANGVFILGGIVFNLADLRIIPQNLLTQYSVHVGSAIEVVLFSLGLADRINVLKTEKESAQQRVIEQLRRNEELQVRAKEDLEEKVVERTQQLTRKTTELETTLTRLQTTQSQLLEAEKLASLGQLTAGIAHEINNPVNFITSNIGSLRLDFDDLKQVVTIYQAADSKATLSEAHTEAESLDVDFLFEEVEGLLKGVEEGATRTQAIVTGLRNFSRMDEDSFKRVDLHEGIDSTLTLLKNQLKTHITVHKNYSPLPDVECLPGKLNQVFMNILTNAIQAMPERGDIYITSQQNADTVEISIRDTGMGMDEAARKRLFEPFFTTKPIGEGTGLGLSISYGIVEKHHGQIMVQSELGEGTTFTLVLPVQQPS
ncbi:MAG: 7TM diverse intracellular signaling domain-containing protein [Cyanobacteria bacterium P01_A01_bin.123]